MGLPNNISLLYALGAGGSSDPLPQYVNPNCVFMSLKHYTELLNHRFGGRYSSTVVVSWTFV